MKEEIKVLELDKYEHGILVNSLNSFRTELIKEDKPIEDVDSLILKLFDLPLIKKKIFSKRYELEVR